MPELLDIIGQDAAVAQLQRALSGERRTHAYLFLGPAGVGRRTTAVALARALLCEAPQARRNQGRLAGLDEGAELRQACGICPSCRMIESGSHGDFHLVYKELARYHDDPKVRERVMQELGIPVIRQFLIGPAYRRAARGRGKVFVVLEAELMSSEAQNALLKTLEEPPPGVTIVLICRDAEELLATTRSRCWTVRFGPLPRDFVRDKLVEAGVEASEADFWAAFTDGSVGRALKLAAQGFYAIKRDLVDRLGADSQAELADWLVKTTGKLADQAVAEAKQAVEGQQMEPADEDDEADEGDESKQGEGAERPYGVRLSRSLASRRAVGTILELVASVFRDAVSLATKAGLPAVHADQPAGVEALARRFGPVQLAEVLEQLGRYERLLWRNVNPKIVWDNVAVTCASAAPLRL